MVRKEFCDRCGDEIESEGDEFSNMFNEMSSHFDKSKQLILQPHLCDECKKG